MVNVLQFQREPASPELLAELTPLGVLHYREISHTPDIPFDPDFNAYLQLEALGMLRIFTARKDGECVGYSFHYVKTHPHFRTSLQAVQDLLFIHPEHRGFGLKFVKWFDSQLAAEGVQVTYQYVNVNHDFGSLLQRAGYSMVDHVYTRRLNRGGL